MIGTIANKKACSGSAGVNTGKLGCLSLFGTPKHLVALTKGTIISASDNFDLAYILPMVQKGTMIPLIAASSFEDLTPDDSYNTNSAGEKRLNLKALPEYKLWFEEGHEFYREVAKMEGYKNYDFIIGDGDGNWLIAKTSSGDFRGFDAGHVTPELTQRKVEGGDSEMKAVMVQFLNRIQFDRNYSIIHAADIDFAPDEFPLVNGTEISYEANPANTDTVIQVKVVLAADRSTIVEGLEAGDFVVDVNGSSATISSVNESAPGIYDITISAAIVTNDVVKVDNFDGTTNTLVAEASGLLYRNTLDNEVTAA